VFLANATGSWAAAGGGANATRYTYDANGNLKTLLRQGRNRWAAQ